MTATCSLISSRRNAGVVGNVAIWASARLNCSTASTNAERANERCPALRTSGKTSSSGLMAFLCSLRK